MNNHLVGFIQELKKRKVHPKNIQTSDWGRWFLVSCFDQTNSSFISESVSMGIDVDPSIAMWKAITEHCERHFSSLSGNSAVRATKRSDGFAAFPHLIVGPVRAKALARENALNEAVERYLWSTWWDNPEVEHQIESPVKLEEKFDLQSLVTEFDLNEVFAIKLRPVNLSLELLILVASKKDGGFFSGGACSSDANLGSRQSRAFGELLRHLMAFKKMRNATERKLSFYEQRLWGFGSGQFTKVCQNRIEKRGSVGISLPELVIDSCIEHPHEDIISIHRCLFLDQPIFMGGDVDRFCI